MRNHKKIYFIRAAILTALFYCLVFQVNAQPPGIQEFGDATRMVKSQYHALTYTASILGAIFGLVGGLRVYNNWQSGKHHIDAQVMGWLGAFIFLQLIAVIMGAMYGV
ncbi:DUF4134 domain-containing protein (plasmid) [Mucilaginibacter robiniae]|uniref:DUF4134 domain-containing protein n=1 Tax=Mucilaginibacter robiniae TaxID=2728022 RepID=A0A7L5E6F6_9SPHI|nr:DUF4134 family protein [Mucilaginibacter robiniae]QJD98561.1 DUF4134 domain-containing protein [Mucilaginibacter robiniae]